MVLERDCCYFTQEPFPIELNIVLIGILSSYKERGLNNVELFFLLLKKVEDGFLQLVIFSQSCQKLMEHKKANTFS